MFLKYIPVWPVPLAQVLPRPRLIFPSKTWLFGIYLNFQQQKSVLNQYLPHSESKSYHINSIKSCSSRFFQQHQRHIPILPNFHLQFIFILVKKSFDIQELLYHKSKCHETKSMHPSSLRAFRRDREHNLNHHNVWILKVEKWNLKFVRETFGIWNFKN